MSCIVSIGDSPEENWMVQNAIYSWYIGLANSHCTDEELTSRLTMSELTNGISLDDVLQEDAAVARRLAILLRSVAADVAAGKYALTDAQGRHRPEMEQGVQEACSKLVRMLDTWPALGDT